MEKEKVKQILDKVKADNRHLLTELETKEICMAYDIPVPTQKVAKTPEEAIEFAREIGYPVVLKIHSPDITHKTDAGGVKVSLKSETEVKSAFDEIMTNAKKYDPKADILGVLVQSMAPEAREVIIGGATDPTFGKTIMFGLGGVFVEQFKDVTFRLAPVSKSEALEMMQEIKGYPILKGVRGEPSIDFDAIASIAEKASQLVMDFPEITELDLNPIFAFEKGATAVDARAILTTDELKEFYRPPPEEIIRQMNRIFHPKSVAVIGASSKPGKIGYSVVKNMTDGGYKGKIYPVHPKEEEILGYKCYKNIKEVPDKVDVAVFCIPAKFVPGVIAEIGEAGVQGGILIPSGFAEVGKQDLQDEAVRVARKYGVRLMGPNIYGYYYTPEDLCATFCTPYTERGVVALSSQSGGVGMAIIGFSRSKKMGVSAIVGLGNKCDLDEDDLIYFFGQDPNTQIFAMHVEDLKDGRSFFEAAKKVSKEKPLLVLKAGRTELGARAATSHTGAMAGVDPIYEAVFKQCGVIRAYALNDLLEFARALQMLPIPKGENVLIVTGAGGSGVLLSDACVDNDLKLMTLDPDLDEAFREFIPPFGATGNPVDITGGQPPETYKSTIELALNDPRVHSIILGYWHTIITPPMAFARVVGEAVEEARAKGINKPVVASLVGDVEVEEACKYLEERDIPAYPYTTETPVAVLGAVYKWARAAGKIGE